MIVAFSILVCSPTRCRESTWCGRVSSDEKHREDLSENTLLGAMMSKGVSYAALAGCLSAIGVEDNELNSCNKASRGRFFAVFLMQCLLVLKAEWIYLPKDLNDAAGKNVAQFLALKSPVGI